MKVKEIMLWYPTGIFDFIVIDKLRDYIFMYKTITVDIGRQEPSQNFISRWIRTPGNELCFDTRAVIEVVVFIVTGLLRYQSIQQNASLLAGRVVESRLDDKKDRCCFLEDFSTRLNWKNQPEFFIWWPTERGGSTIGLRLDGTDAGIAPYPASFDRVGVGGGYLKTNNPGDFRIRLYKIRDKISWFKRIIRCIER